MNTANAFGFLGVGLVMWLMPIVIPGWFPHVAMDGSSTRALWSQTMGLVQLVLGLSYLLQRGYVALQLRPAKAGVQRGAVATGDWQTDGLPAGVLAVDQVRAPEPEPVFAEPQWVPAVAAREVTVTLHGRRAALWRMLEKAWATEERLSDFIARAGRRGLALRATGLPAELAKQQAGAEGRDPLRTLYELLAEDVGRQHADLGKAA